MEGKSDFLTVVESRCNSPVFPTEANDSKRVIFHFSSHHLIVTNTHILQPPFPRALQSFPLLPTILLRTKVNTNTINTMSLILRIPKPLPLKNMPQMPSTVITHNLRPHHAKARIRALAHRARHRVPESRPPAPGVEFVVCFVERGFAAAAGVDARGGVVLVVGAGAGGFGALLTEDSELLWETVR